MAVRIAPQLQEGGNRRLQIGDQAAEQGLRLLRRIDAREAFKIRADAHEAPPVACCSNFWLTVTPCCMRAALA